MAKIESGIGVSGVETTAGPKTYIVDHEPAPQHAQIDEQLLQFEGPVVEDKPVEFDLPKQKEASSDLSDLIFIGRLSNTVEIDGVSFEISTLTNREFNEIIKTMYKFDDTSDIFTFRVLVLSRALRTINGKNLDDINIDGEFESGFQKRTTIIDHLQISVVERLFKEYEVLTGKKDETEKDNEEVKK